MIKTKRLSVALIQMNSGENKAENIEAAVSLVEEAAANKADFILLPETFNFRPAGTGHAAAAECIPGPSTQPLIDIAASRGVYILAGSIYEKASSYRKSYNSSVLIGKDGNIKAIYRKMHLFDVSLGGKKISESRTFLKGKEPVLSLVSGVMVGLSICFDLRFPELYRRYSNSGARILCVPSSFTKETGEVHWEALLRARAIENQSFVLAPDQCGKGAGSVMTYGNSMIIDPWGRILARASASKEEIIYAELDLTGLERTRKFFPFLKHRVIRSA